MGAEFEVDSLEDMCDLMCNNRPPTPKRIWWYFTFGCGQEHAGHYTKIFGTYGEARKKMFDRYGDQWAFQYSEEDWIDWCERRPPWVPAETELEETE